MQVHIHLPKTAGTTFNFGIARHIFDPSEVLLAGSEMPLRALLEVQPTHLQGKQFMSGHFTKDFMTNKAIENEIISGRNFIFGFVRTSKKLFPSAINQIVKMSSNEEVPIQYINEQLESFYKYYIEGAEAILQNGGLLLRSDSKSEFFASLNTLHDIANYPILNVKPLNQSDTNIQYRKLKALTTLDWSVIDDIYYSSSKSVSHVTYCEEITEDFVQLKPNEYDVVSPIRGEDSIKDTYDNKLLVWISNPEVKRIQIRIRRNLSNIDLDQLEKAGIRKDLYAHQPIFNIEEKNPSIKSFGIPITKPYSEVTIATNLSANDHIGELISYKLRFTSD